MKKFQTAFKVLCLSAAVSMTIYCSYEFLQNNDLSEISFVIYNQNDESIYPQLSACFINQWALLDGELRRLGDGINSTSYLQFLKGQMWDDRMVDVDIKKVMVKIEDHVLDTCVRSSFEGNCEGKGKMLTHIYSYAANCLAFHYLQPKSVFEASMWVKSSVFLNGIRPPTGWKFIIKMVYPQQVLRMTAPMGLWPVRQNASDTYAMNFHVRDVVVIRRRNKPGSRCSDWKNYDSFATDGLLSNVGCRPFNSTSMQKYSACNTKEKMARLYGDTLAMIAGNLDMAKHNPPCNEIQKIQVSHHEEESNSAKEKSQFPSLKTDLEKIDGWFRITVQFHANTFMEIKQVRAYNVQSLIGNAGGYMGLLVGYTIAEIPSLVVTAYQYFVPEKKN